MVVSYGSFEQRLKQGELFMANTLFDLFYSNKIFSQDKIFCLLIGKFKFVWKKPKKQQNI